MKDGFIKVAAAMPKVTVADVTANTENIKSLILAADEKKVNLQSFVSKLLFFILLVSIHFGKITRRDHTRRKRDDSDTENG